MSKTIVNIMSTQTMPTYLFIKDYYIDGDKLLFIESSTSAKQKEYILDAFDRVDFRVDKDAIDIVAFSNEENWHQMCEELEKRIDEETTYYVNTTGGTKYMALAVQKVFEKMPDVHFFYMPYPKNKFLYLNGNKQDVLHVKTRVTIEEYMAAFKSIKFNVKNPTQSEEYTNFFFHKFTNCFDEKEFGVIEGVRKNFRNNKCEVRSIVEVDQKDTELITNEGSVSKKRPEKKYSFGRIEGIVDFLEKSKFQPKEKDQLDKYEIEYLTGGWFEEYLYFQIKKEIDPDDIALGLNVNQNENANPNDLDVVFTKNNKLFVIECKTGITAVGDRSETAMFKEIAYKAASIRATLLGGLSEKSYICSLSESKESYKIAAKNMKISYFDRNDFTDGHLYNTFIDAIKMAANQ